MMGAKARLAGVLAVLALLASCGPAYRGEPLYGPLDTTDPQVALGEQLYNVNCQQCHPGGNRGLAFSINDKPLTAGMIKFQVRNGLGVMPSFSEERISDTELDALVSYLMALKQNDRETRD